MDRLSTLSDPLLVQIFEAVGRISRSDLCNVARLNKRYHKVADPILYRTIRLESAEHHIIFTGSLRRRPRYASAIQDITVKFHHDHDATNSESSNSSLIPHGAAAIEGLSRAISTMSNLETLDIAVPAKLLHGMGLLFNGPFDLFCLKSCTLYYQCPDDQYWDLRENIHVLAHPTLEILVIRRAKLDHRGFDHIEQPHGTGLKKLHLIECDINDGALSDILEFPKELREFVMTQLREPFPELEESSDNIGDYMYALRSAGHSLETITIDFPTLTGYKALRMRDFVVLHTLRMNWDHQLFGKSSKKARMHSVGIPSELETFEFFDELGTDEEVTDLLEYTIQNRAVVAAKLGRIIAPAGDRGGPPKAIVEACKAQNVRLDIIGCMDSDADTDTDDEDID